MEEEEESHSSGEEGDYSSSSEEDERCEVLSYELDALEQNAKESFTFGSIHGDVHRLSYHERWWTTEEWRTLFTGLLRNTSVETVRATLNSAPMEALSLFVDFVRTSRKLKDLTIAVQFDPLRFNSLEIPENLRSKIDEILQAVQQNPSIQALRLFCLGNPGSIRDLLTGNTSLKIFELRLFDKVSAGMAGSIAAGLKDNDHLNEVLLFVRYGNLDTILSGIGHRNGNGNNNNNTGSNLESRTLWTQHPERNPQLGLRVFQGIQCTPSLKKLVIDGDGDPRRLSHIPPYCYGNTGRYSCEKQPLIDFLLKNLHQPALAQVEALELRRVSLAASHDVDVGDNVTDTCVLSPIQENTTLKDITLHKVTFCRRSSQSLRNYKGLTQLRMTRCVCTDDSNDTSNEGRANVESDGPVYLAEFVRQCTQLRQVSVGCGSTGLDAVGVSIMNGARAHPVLQVFTLTLNHADARLRRLLQVLLNESQFLTDLRLHFDRVDAGEGYVVGLANGLRHRTSLQKLYLEVPRMSAEKCLLMLEGMVVNQTLQHFDCKLSAELGNPLRVVYNNQESDVICEALSRVFRANTSLFHLTLPPLLLKSRMQGLLEGLRHQEAFRSLDYGYCLADDQGFHQLGQTLEDNQSIPLEHIGLPSHSDSRSTGLVSFFRSLARMRHVKTVVYSSRDLRDDDDNTRWWAVPYNEDDENNKNDACLRNVLLAVKENKTICSFQGLENFLGRLKHNPLVSEIEYFLKLNRFGRGKLPGFAENGCQRVWPVVLARLASKPEDADALFFFIRVYMHFSGKQSSVADERAAPSQPRKKARVAS